MVERVESAACLQGSTEGLFTIPDPLPAQSGADSPYPIEGPVPTLSNGEPDAEVQPACACCCMACMLVSNFIMCLSSSKELTPQKKLLAKFQQAQSAARQHDTFVGHMLHVSALQDH